jgi:L-rhamnose isomerase/sugar isomerase
MKDIYAALPDDWRVFTEHKMYEPAFYSTVVQDWGSNYLIARNSARRPLPRRSRPPCAERQYRDDRRAPHPVRKLGGFHFNDSKYGDDDLDTPARSIPTGCSSSSTSWSMRSARPRVFDPATCSTRATM